MVVDQQAGANAYFGPSTNAFFHCLGEHQTYNIPLVTECTHLGGKAHFSGNLRARLGQAHQEFNRHRKLLYQNSCFPMAKKRELFHSVILSRLLYGSETWVTTDQKTRDHLHGSLIGLYKRLLKCSAGDHISLPHGHSLRLRNSFVFVVFDILGVSICDW